MKILFKRSILFFLAVSILLSSSGITIYKMVCGSSKKELVSLSQIKNCCENEEQETTTFEKKCCDFSTQTFKVTLLQKNESNPLLLFSLTEKVHSPLFYTSKSNTSKLTPITKSRLLLSGRQILQLKATFLI